MSPKAKKRNRESEGGSRKKKTRENDEVVEMKKTKKLKTNNHVTFNDEEEIGGKSNNKIDAPKSSAKTDSDEQGKDCTSKCTEISENITVLIAFLVDWSASDLQELVKRMELLIPEKDNMAYSTRVEKLNWEKVGCCGIENYFFI